MATLSLAITDWNRSNMAELPEVPSDLMVRDLIEEVEQAMSLPRDTYHLLAGGEKLNRTTRSKNSALKAVRNSLSRRRYRPAYEGKGIMAASGFQYIERVSDEPAPCLRNGRSATSGIYPRTWRSAAPEGAPPNDMAGGARPGSCLFSTRRGSPESGFRAAAAKSHMGSRFSRTMSRPFCTKRNCCTKTRKRKSRENSPGRFASAQPAARRKRND